MHRTQGVSVVAVFSALIIASDFALVPFPNVKLLDTLVFVVAFLFGLKNAAAVAVVSETIWSLVSPWGVAPYALIPFLVGGELLFALAGWWASRIWGERGRLLSPNSLFMGSLMLICAFVWDFETNAATALIASWPTFGLGTLLLYEGMGIPFAFVHEEADFLLGMLVVPAAVLLVPKVLRVKM